jgi:ABC-type polysaccharide/polyol phosphate transport system ATPase subunit
MNPAIRADRLCKVYDLHDMERAPRTLGETITELMGTPWRKLRQSWQRVVHHDESREQDGRDVFWALKDVSFEIQPGEVVGVIGPNGAGKSTLFKILSRITRPTSGRVEIRGRLGSLLEVGTGFHPELSGRENVFLNGAILGMSRREIERKYDEIVAFAEINQFIDMPVKRYSSGMYLRLAFAVSAHLEPDILLLDEVMAVGDAEFQEKSHRRIHHLTRQGITTLIVSHSPDSIRPLAKRCIYIRTGSIVFDGDIEEAMELYAADVHHDIDATEAPEERTESIEKEAAAEEAPAMVLGGTAESEDELPMTVREDAGPGGEETASIQAEIDGEGQPHQDMQNALLWVTATDADGRLVVSQGTDLHVTIAYKSLSSFPRVHFQVTIWTKQGVMLTCADTREDEQPEFPTGEEIKAVCVFPSLSLKSGRYLIRVAMINPDSPRGFLSTYGWGNDPRVCSFLLGPAAIERAPGYPHQTDCGLVRLPHRWHHSEPSSARVPDPSGSMGNGDSAAAAWTAANVRENIEAGASGGE